MFFHVYKPFARIQWSRKYVSCAHCAAIDYFYMTIQRLHKYSAHISPESTRISFVPFKLQVRSEFKTGLSGVGSLQTYSPSGIGLPGIDQIVTKNKFT